MDWAKAKNIIILALVVLNVFLLFMFGVLTNNVNVQEEEDLFAEVQDLLVQRDIDLKIDLPEESGDVPVVIVDRIGLSDARIEHLIAAEKILAPEERDEAHIRAKAQNFLEELGVWNDDTFIAQYEVGGDGSVLLTFGSSVNGIPVEISNLYCYVSGGKVAVVIGVWMTGSGEGQPALPTISPVDALLKFIGSVPRSYDKDGNLIPLHITKMEMVYHFDNDAMMNGLTVSDTAFPYWKFTYIVGSEEESVNELGAKIAVVTRSMYVDAYGER